MGKHLQSCCGQTIYSFTKTAPGVIVLHTVLEAHGRELHCTETHAHVNSTLSSKQWHIQPSHWPDIRRSQCSGCSLLTLADGIERICSLSTRPTYGACFSGRFLSFRTSSDACGSSSSSSCCSYRSPPTLPSKPSKPSCLATRLPSPRHTQPLPVPQYHSPKPLPNPILNTSMLPKPTGTAATGGQSKQSNQVQSYRLVRKRKTLKRSLQHSIAQALLKHLLIHTRLSGNSVKSNPSLFYGQFALLTINSYNMDIFFRLLIVDY
jgi:hypothetical protein